jgi:hypothetical protein
MKIVKPLEIPTSTFNLSSSTGNGKNTKFFLVKCIAKIRIWFQIKYNVEIADIFEMFITENNHR